MSMRQLGEGQVSTLRNALGVAAERYRENAAALRETAKAGGSAFIAPKAAQGLAEQFDRQDTEARLLAGLLDEHSLALIVEA